MSRHLDADGQEMKLLAKDASADFARNLAVDALAIALFNSFTVYHAVPNFGFRDLPDAAKAHYRQRARAELKALTPEPRGSSPYFTIAADMARSEFGSPKVIGSISPEAPYGTMEEQP